MILGHIITIEDVSYSFRGKKTLVTSSGAQEDRFHRMRANDS